MDVSKMTVSPTARYMWRIWVYRTTEPQTSNSTTRADFGAWSGLDTMTGVDLTEEATRDVAPVWDAMLAYTAGLPPPPPALRLPGVVQSLQDQMKTPGVSAEPARVGAAYR